MVTSFRWVARGSVSARFVDHDVRATCFDGCAVGVIEEGLC
jgi:hypothetical protein